MICSASARRATGWEKSNPYRSRRSQIHYPGANPQYRRPLCHVRHGEHRLGDENGVAADRLRHTHPEPQVASPGGQIAQQRLVVEVFVRRGAARGEPAELLIPDRRRKHVLKMIDRHQRLEPDGPGIPPQPPSPRPAAAQYRPERPRKSVTTARSATPRSYVGKVPETAAGVCRARVTRDARQRVRHRGGLRRMSLVFNNLGRSVADTARYPRSQPYRPRRACRTTSSPAAGRPWPP